MKLDLSSAKDELADLHDSVQRVLNVEAHFLRRRAIAASAGGWHPPTWQQLAALGIASLCAPDHCGGFDRGAAEWGDVQRLFGRALSLEPALATYLCTVALRRHAGPEVQQRLLAPVLEGAAVIAWAHDEPDARHVPTRVDTVARPEHNGRWRLSGLKSNVLHGPMASSFIVTARVGGAADQADGLALFALDATEPGAIRRDMRLVDDTPATELTLRDAVATPLAPGAIGHAGPDIQAVLHAGAAAVCADMVGVMELALALTLEHVRTRHQFGRALAENQAVRHKVADMVVQLEAATSMAMLAAAAIDDPVQAGTADVKRAKIVVGRSARSVAHAAIQLHGGLGMSEEHAAGHCLRRVIVEDQLFGDPDTHAAELGASLARGLHHA